MNISLRNIKQELVEKILKEVLEGYDCCKCEKCRLDAMAITLNHIKPHYLVTHKGEAIILNRYLIPDSRAEILSECVRAVEKVRDNPQHITDD